MVPMTAPVLALLAAALCGAPTSNPSLAVVVVRRASLAKAAADNVAVEVTAALQAAGVVVDTPPSAVAQKLKAANLPESETCEGAKLCVLGMGGKLGVAALVAIEAGALGKSVAIHLEAVTIPEGKRLAQHDILAQQDSLRNLPGLDGFAGKVRTALSTLTVAPPPPPVAGGTEPAGTDKPKASTGQVTVRETHARADDNPKAVPPEAVAKRAPEGKSHTAAWVVGAGAVGAGIAAAVLGIFAVATKDQLDREMNTSRVPGTTNHYTMDGTRAHNLANQANTMYYASMGCLGGLGALGVVTVIVW